MADPHSKPPVIVASEEDEPEEPEAEAPPAAVADEPDAGEVPDETRYPEWAKVPTGLKIPAGRKLWFVALDTSLMARTTGGEEIELRGKKRTCRQLIFWECNLGDRKLAFKRANGDANQAADELAMQMIRAVDGVAVTWSELRSPAYPPRIWADMGSKYRDLLHKLYASIHVLGQRELDDFFTNCVELRTAASA